MALAPIRAPLSQVNLPNLGDATYDELPPAVERKLGERIWGEIQRGHEAFDDLEITEYLNVIGNELATTATAPGGSGSGSAITAGEFTFFAVQDSTINAFALPGGYIAVHTGLLSATQTESELASVLGHEIGHVTQRHIARMLGQQKTTSLAMLGAMVLGLLAASRGGSSAADLAQATILFSQAGAMAQQLSFSRDAEREADRVGFQTLASSGYVAQGMVDFFGRLQNASRYESANAPAYLRSHPLTGERISDIQNRVQKERYRQRVDRFEFLLAKARARALSDTSVNGLNDARIAFENQTAFASTGHNLPVAAAYYGIAVTAMRQRDYKVAEHALLQVRLSGEAHQFLDKLQAELQIARGDNSGAVATMEAARIRWPASHTNRVFMAEALQSAGLHARAIEYLRDQIALYRGDPKLFDLLAKSYEATGQAARQHQALAEVYRLWASLQPAVDQLEIAQKLLSRSSSDEDIMFASEVATRLRELKGQLKEELKDTRDKS
jgi:predicted Zn-dependent protease